MDKFKVGDTIRVTDDSFKNLIGETGILITIDHDDSTLPYRVRFNEPDLEEDWVKNVELVEEKEVKPTIDSQELADFLAQYNSHSDDLIREVSEKFNLPDPTPNVKTFTVTIEGDLADFADTETLEYLLRTVVGVRGVLSVEEVEKSD